MNAVIEVSDPNTDSEPIELVRGLPPQTVCDRLHVANRSDGMSSRMLAFYLEEMNSRRIYQTSGHASTAHWAADQLDMDERRARELVQIGDALLQNEELDAALLDSRLSWSKVMLLASIVMPHTQTQWIELAMRKNCAQVRRDVAQARQGRNPTPAGEGQGSGKGGLREPRFRFKASYGAGNEAAIEQVREEAMRDLGKLVTDDELFAWLLECGKEKVRKRTERDAAHPAECKPLGPEDPIPAAMRKDVLARDGFACQCCGATTELHLHHIVFRENGGATSRENLLTACASCHGRIHAGLLIVQGVAPGAIEMLGKNGEPLRPRGFSAEPVLRILRRRIGDLRRGDGDDLRESAANIRRGKAQTPLPQTLSLDEIPAVVDSDWWARHEHLLEWRRGGLRVKPSARG